VEKVLLGWKLIGYSYPVTKGSKYLFFIVPMKEHIKLGFEYGTQLADPDSLLSGDGTQVRYLESKTLKDIRSGRHRPFVAEAVEMVVERWGESR
jgi:hypothetical protein